MGIWSAYFFCKLFLYWTRHIEFHVLPNLAFALFLIVPLGPRWLRIARQVIAIAVGIALLYDDAWLPPASQALAKLPALLEFDAPYLFELLGRFISGRTILALALIVAAHELLRRKLRMSTFALIGILSVPLTGMLHAPEPTPSTGAVSAAADATAQNAPVALTPQALDATLRRFHETEANRRVQFSPVDADGPPFDIVLLHTCSLAWDDLDYAGLREHPLLKRFDLVFDNFNAAASYSGPAAIRLLRGACGQAPHAKLYDRPDPGCQLMRQLERAGFAPQWQMNHDGAFGGFAETVRDHLGVAADFTRLSGGEVTQRAFDGSPVYDDYDVLSRWWAERAKNPAAHVALYYSGISLHDGNRAIGARPSSNQEYFRLRVQRYLDDAQRFVHLLEQSGRRVIVALVPEHGAAVRGDRVQISGLREIPNAAISLVPVGVALIEPGRSPPASPLRIDAPTSFLALSQLLARLVADSPFAEGHQPLPGYAADLPQTAFVSENENTVVMRVGERYMMRTPDGSWSRYEGDAP
ncbi:MAG: cellulose biosynthesis protein BcsG [Sinimarinibacterium sp.]|jgi:cellulose synthase operon protein YhjU